MLGGLCGVVGGVEGSFYSLGKGGERPWVS
jgi:hypothetical protein